ncbi:hypothetical protein ON010_g16277 [Phytophthora cinnamomi]|nr:hypothetical protein ON010_g16277 [Phytophthora cinnamomi]
MDSINRGEAIEVFRHEVNIWFGFNHAHVIRLFGACCVGTPFFDCEHATNGTLVEYSKTHPGQTRTKQHEAAMGIQYLRARKVVHGNLQGNNIVIRSDMKAKVTDFGLGSPQEARLNLKYQARGIGWRRSAYLKQRKQQHPGNNSPTYESDIYSLGMYIVEAIWVVEDIERVKLGRSINAACVGEDSKSMM